MFQIILLRKFGDFDAEFTHKIVTQINMVIRAGKALKMLYFFSHLIVFQLH